MKEIDPQTASNDVVVRSLRRRLWQAFELNDASLAIRAFCADRKDWETWMNEEKVNRKGRSHPPIEMKPTDESSTTSRNGILQKYMNPSLPFELDDYRKPHEKFDEIEQEKESYKEKPKRALKTPMRLLFNKPPKVQLDPNTDPRMTTPLHEAARLGNLELLKLMIDCQGDPNVRNGVGRTALHMVAGAVFQGEKGIPTTKPIAQPVKKNGLKKLFKKKDRVEPQPRVFSQLDINDLEHERLECARMLLKWRHPHDGSDCAGDGPSINAVDTRGRTALHYAAELGREEISIDILNYFGTMMTIVDDQANTPCELAAEGGYERLAFELEARTLLYIDPYGMDNELLQGVSNSSRGHPKRATIVPFKWFETYNIDTIHKAREAKIDEGFKKMREILNLHAKGLQMMKDRQKAEEEGITRPMTSEERFLSAFEFDSEEDIKNLQVMHRGHVELFLRHHKNNVREAMIAFIESPRKAFQEAGIPVPVVDSDETQAVQTCLICSEDFDITSNDWWQMQSCEHAFCVDCLKGYLQNLANTQAQGMTALCPHHECSSPFCPTEILDLTESEIHAKLKQVSAENFVVSSYNTKYCPHPDCGGIIQFNVPHVNTQDDVDPTQLFTFGAVCTACSPANGREPVTYEGIVDPNYYSCRATTKPLRAHRFCFACNEEGSHFPVQCHRIDDWKQAIREHVAEVEEDGEEAGDYNDIAQKLWMKANTRPCPKCKAPIEKDEGCNHMTCSNPQCKHEFCWICRNDWKLHSTDTGGFFRCNRWVDQDENDFYDKPNDLDKVKATELTNEDLADPRTMQHTYGTAMHETRIHKKKRKEMERFLHHFHRWSAHSESAELEERMLDNVQEKMKPVIEAAEAFLCDTEFNFSGHGLSFIYSAFLELLECRSVLKYSYAYSYFRYNFVGLRKFKKIRRKMQEKLTFEQLQSELETMTEQISNAVARKHFRATQSQIMYLTAAASEKRREFSNIMVHILLLEQKEIDREEAAMSGETVSNQSKNDFRSRFLRLLESGPAAANRPPAVVHDDDEEEEDPHYNPANDDEFEEALEQSLRTGRPMRVTRAQIASDWSCTACTFINQGGYRCTMCGSRRMVN